MASSPKGLPLDLGNIAAHFSLDPLTKFFSQETGEQKLWLHGSVQEAQAALMTVSR